MKTLVRWAAALSLSSLMIGLAGATPARADDGDWRDNGQRGHVRYDIRDIRQDQQRLRDLQRRRDEERRCRRWDNVRDLDRQIGQLQWHIAQDRRDVHQDIRRYRDDRRDHWDDYSRGRDSRNRGNDNADRRRRDNNDYRRRDDR